MYCELENKIYQLEYSKCIKNLRDFVDIFFNTAIKKGYFKAEDAQKELGWNPQSSKILELKKFSSTSLFGENYNVKSI